ncbi:hypothetical protein [Mycoplasma bradburyae]|uniref:Uncharacterized protein n=1 Tax=Mycoplasma bradburyae TaxID=2963128 RepID=A0AAW6HRF4_9MOLU|nr:hypothetical protein [Mycoplasma bradburyae]MDC4183371.1 hypothetical protein [Mycoplasma bradburyae]UTS71144.1 hypothetical protein NMG77_01630 [Mycoplasma bradburyae]
MLNSSSDSNKTLQIINRLPKRWQKHRLANVIKPYYLNWKEYFFINATRQANRYLKHTKFNWLYLIPIVGFIYFIFKIESTNEKLEYSKLKNQYLKVGGENWIVFLIIFAGIYLSFIIWATLIIYLTDYFYPPNNYQNINKIIIMYVGGNFIIFILFHYFYLFYWYLVVYQKFKNSVYKIIAITRNKIHPYSFFSFVLHCDDGVYLKKLEKRHKRNQFFK